MKWKSSISINNMVLSHWSYVDLIIRRVLEGIANQLKLVSHLGVEEATITSKTTDCTLGINTSK